MIKSKWLATTEHGHAPSKEAGQAPAEGLREDDQREGVEGAPPSAVGRVAGAERAAHRPNPYSTQQRRSQWLHAYADGVEAVAE